jgi:two-component system chemotaxis response regulator CheB
MITASGQPITVLIVDDSALVRRTIRRLLEESPDLRVVGEARDGAEAIDRVAELSPTVVTLDVDMPVMDGLSALPRLVQDYRQRVVMLSTLTTAQAYPTFKALALGAIDFVTKPGIGTYLRNLDDLGVEIREKVRMAARVPRFKIGRSSGPRREPAADSWTTSNVAPFPSITADRVVGIGGSTGGTGPLEMILADLPDSGTACVVVVQHLPPGFSGPFTSYLAGLSRFDVCEATPNEVLLAGRVYLAPASAHLRVQRVGGSLVTRFDHTSAPVNGFRPSIDTFFFSMALAAKGQAIGVILSGMGRDGAKGLAAVGRMGGTTLCQATSSCVVAEMPQAAIAMGNVDHVLGDERLSNVVSRICGDGSTAWKTAR